jgi:hypothetical protein
LGDRLHASPVRVLAEDLADDRRFSRLDLEPSGRATIVGPGIARHGNGPVAVEAAARAQTSRDGPRKPAVGLVAEIVEVELVDQALDGKVHLGALPTCGDPVTHPDQLDALETEARGDAEELGHVTGEPRQIFDQDDLEGRRRAQRRGE